MMAIMAITLLLCDVWSLKLSMKSTTSTLGPGIYSVGLDFGTTGARSTVMDTSSLEIVSEEHIEWSSMRSYSEYSHG